ncbi:MAG: hypothetical protein RMJ15_05995 [Nitrososphaerota archaeon]|nr:hypothetical protein [Candidatus Bathyarchaeota archaeon]MDW8023268.1 hypothetical protein [Nitrososphaerota archaeon]
MLETNRGKLVVYTSSLASYQGRLKPVSAAAEKAAKALNLDLEIITLEGKAVPICIYYKDGDGEPIPIYCDKNQRPTVKKVCSALKSMMFVLSFHPKYSALRKIRKEIMQFS